MLGVSQVLESNAALKGVRKAMAGQARSMERLSTGNRINRAGDDVARSAIASQLETRVRSQGQASRNINDAISVIQTAEGGCAEIQDILSRCRELTIQAGNEATLNSNDKAAIQQELDLLIAEVDRIANTTEYNGQSVLKASNAAEISDIITALKTNWLQHAEDRIATYYGIQGDNQTLEIEVHTLDGAGGTAAYVSGYVNGATGQIYNQELHVDIDDHTPAVANSDGGSAPMYADRIMAHEMVHAVMGRAMNQYSIPTWFSEGAAEFIHGADERVAIDIAASSFTSVRDQIGDGTNSAWGGASKDYSSGYMATRYLHKIIKANGGNGVKDIMTWMAANTSRTFDRAIANLGLAGISNNATFVAAFKANVSSLGDADINTSNTDTGAIGGADADSGATLTATSVIPNTGTSTDDPLDNFVESWPDDSTDSFKFQISSASGNDAIFDASSYMPDARATSLGLTGIDITSSIADALGKIDTAIVSLSSKRAKLGAAQNRLEVALDLSESDEITLASSKSNIKDADIAEETAVMTRQSILGQAATSVLSKLKDNHSLLLQLLG